MFSTDTFSYVSKYVSIRYLIDFTLIRAEVTCCVSNSFSKIQDSIGFVPNSPLIQSDGVLEYLLEQNRSFIYVTVYIYKRNNMWAYTYPRSTHHVKICGTVQPVPNIEFYTSWNPSFWQEDGYFLQYCSASLNNQLSLYLRIHLYKCSVFKDYSGFCESPTWPLFTHPLSYLTCSNI